MSEPKEARDPFQQYAVIARGGQERAPTPIRTGGETSRTDFDPRLLEDKEYVRSLRMAFEAGFANSDEFGSWVRRFTSELEDTFGDDKIVDVFAALRDDYVADPNAYRISMS